MTHVNSTLCEIARPGHKLARLSAMTGQRLSHQCHAIYDEAETARLIYETIAFAQEEWRPIPRTNGRYWASDLGRIVSRAFETPRLMCIGYRKKSGYGMVKLDKSHYVHRLILETFLGIDPERPHSRHNDGDTRNNQLRNLCWGTKSDNERDKRRHGTAPIGTRHPMSKLSERNVLWIRKNADRMSRVAIARRLGVSDSCVAAVIYGKTWNHVRSA